MVYWMCFRRKTPERAFLFCGTMKELQTGCFEECFCLHNKVFVLCFPFPFLAVWVLEHGSTHSSGNRRRNGFHRLQRHISERNVVPTRFLLDSLIVRVTDAPIRLQKKKGSCESRSSPKTFLFETLKIPSGHGSRAKRRRARNFRNE